jgi:haloalkane dehalogenase
MRDTDTKWFKCDDAELAWSEVGVGPPVLLIHGWPMHSQTWRHLTPFLAPAHRVVMVDLAGLGRSRFKATTDMRFESHAARLKAFVDTHLPAEFACLASDTGGTIARHLAARVPRLRHLLLLNTEIPGHRPPWVRLFQLLFALPGGGAGLSMMARTPMLVRSSMGFGGTLKDLRLLTDEFHQLFVAPLQKPGSYRDGVMQYLRGIRWATVDALEQLHPTLRCRVRLVWGADDPTFPVVRAREMMTQFSPPAQIHEIKDARLLVHEEYPAEVAREALLFFAEN